MKLIFLISLLLSPALSHLPDPFVYSQFRSFKEKFNKVYTTSEISDRFQIFSENLQYIDSINSQNLSYKLKVGPFADLTFSEFESKYLRSSLQLATVLEDHTLVLNVTSLPASVNWKTANKVTPPVNQGYCGSCFIFASMASVESAYAILMSSRPDELISLSKQQILDCADYDGYYGCDGGYGYQVFEYLKGVSCLVRAQQYPYTGVERPCNKLKSVAGCISAHVIDWHSVPPNNELQMMAAVVQQPVDASMFAEMRMQHYSSGIIPATTCTKSMNIANHEVLFVGYDQEDEKRYWLGKNSWGAGWGMDGYFMIERNSDNVDSSGACLIASEVVYPVLAV